MYTTGSILGTVANEPCESSLERRESIPYEQETLRSSPRRRSHAPVAALLPARVGQLAFWGSLTFQGVLATCVSLPAMATIPTIIFCDSPDPCSCVGGGFYLYAPLCEARDGRGDSLNTTTGNSHNNVTLSTNITLLQNEYGSILSFLGEDSTAVVVS